MPKTKKRARASEAKVKAKANGNTLPDNQRATLKALRETGADKRKTRKQLREETGIHWLGLPDLIEAGLVEGVVGEGRQRAHLFAITAAGRKTLQAQPKGATMQLMNSMAIGEDTFQLSQDFVWHGRNKGMVDILNARARDVRSTIGPAQGSPLQFNFIDAVNWLGAKIIVNEMEPMVEGRIY